MAFKKILSIDGGGTRGITAAAFIEKLESSLGKSLREEFDLIAGTSTGGIIALCLGLGISGEKIRMFYEDKASKIFPPSFKLWQFVKNIFSAKYSQSGLKAAFREISGSDSFVLNDIDTWRKGEHKIRVMVPVFDLEPVDYRIARDNQKKPVNFRPKVYYSNYLATQNELVEDIVCRTTAGPTYFPLAGQFVDGGVAINHPAMSAVAYAINDSPDDVGERSNSETDESGKPIGIKGLGWKLNEMKVLSVGTGTSYTMRIPSQERGSGNWGILKWANKITNMLTETNVQASEYYVANVLPPGSYLRIQHNLSGIDKYNEIHLDVNDYKILEAMKQSGYENYDARWEDLKRLMGY